MVGLENQSRVRECKVGLANSGFLIEHGNSGYGLEMKNSGECRRPQGWVGVLRIGLENSKQGRRNQGRNADIKIGLVKSGWGWRTIDRVGSSSGYDPRTRIALERDKTIRTKNSREDNEVSVGAVFHQLTYIGDNNNIITSQLPTAPPIPPTRTYIGDNNKIKKLHIFPHMYILGRKGERITTNCCQNFV